MSARRRGQSLSERLRGLFKGRARDRDRLRKPMFTQDYDEVPQRHMMEADKQMVKSRCRSLTAHQKCGTQSSLPGEKNKSPGGDRRADCLDQPRCEQGATSASAGAGRQEGQGEISESETLTDAASPLPPVSPLDLFYHCYVAPYDTRRVIEPDTPTPAPALGKKCVDKKEVFKHGKLLCAKKSSRDNTFGSIDSIHSEDAVGIESGHGADDEDALFETSEVIDARGKQFVADTLKRSGVKAHSLQPRENCPTITPENLKFLIAGPSNKLGELHDKIDAKITMDDLVVNGKPVREKHHLEREYIRPEYVRPLADDVKTCPPTPPLVPGCGLSSEALTFSTSARDFAGREDSQSLNEPDTSDSVNLSAHIENAMVNMKKLQEKVTTSGKYSQVVVTHGASNDTMGASKDVAAGSSSAGETAQGDKVPNETHKYDFSGRVGRHSSFNICGENIYITIGSTKTKIKACRRKHTVRAHSAGIALDGVEAGPSLSKKKSDALHSKKKKLEKKIKKKGKHLSKSSDVKDSVSKTNPENTENVNGISAKELIVGNLDVKDAIINMRGIRSDPVDITTSALQQDNSEKEMMDDVNTHGVDKWHDVESHDSSSSSQNAVCFEPPLCLEGSPEESAVLCAEIENKSNDCRCPSSDLEQAEKEGDNELPESDPAQADHGVDNTADGWVLVTIHSSGQLAQTEIPQAWETVDVLSSSTPETMRIAKRFPQAHKDNNKDILEGKNMETLPHENPNGGEFATVEDEDGEYINQTIYVTVNPHVLSGADRDGDGRTSDSTSATGHSQTVGGHSEATSAPLNNWVKVNQRSPVEEAGANQATGTVSLQPGPVVFAPDQPSPSGQRHYVADVGGAPSDDVDAADVGVATSEDVAVVGVDDATSDDVGVTNGGAVNEDAAVVDVGVAICKNAAVANGGSAVIDDAAAAGADDGECRDVAVNAGFLDVFALKRIWHSQNRTLKKQMTRFRERSNHVIRLQQLIGQLERETAEMRRMLEVLDEQTAALRAEASNLRCTLAGVCDVSGELSRTTEARSLEPACFRRYNNIRTPQDAASLLSAIRSRAKALGELEVLVYRKQLVLHHGLHGSTQDRLPAAKRVIRAIHKGPKSKKPDEASAKKGNIVIEVVSPSLESACAVTPSWSDEVDTESPITTSAPFSESVEGETTPPIYQVVDASNN
ncbi:hypothetical protein EGW08_017475 [Elysia chlorotica]|uniref:Uncharacterized protein n=1 Tax=Elysia chlorotica TaxID=188477 RepID=A0A433SZQ7_ELYCH|nr:hypothetical protein EGW08_017475 [Elysia chlorotica]